MSVRIGSTASLTAIIVASLALVLALAGGASITSVASAAEDVPAVAQVGADDVSEQTPGDEAQLRPAQPQMFHDDDDVWNGWWVIMPIMMVVFWGGVVVLVVWAVRQFTQDRGQNRSPLDIARERLARGEISKDEFEAIKDDLV